MELFRLPMSINTERQGEVFNQPLLIIIAETGFGVRYVGLFLGDECVGRTGDKAEENAEDKEVK